MRSVKGVGCWAVPGGRELFHSRGFSHPDERRHRSGDHHVCKGGKERSSPNMIVFHLEQQWYQNNRKSMQIIERILSHHCVESKHSAWLSCPSNSLKDQFPWLGDKGRQLRHIGYCGKYSPLWKSRTEELFSHSILTWRLLIVLKEAWNEG